MGVDTRVKLMGKVEAEAIAEWIKNNIDENVKLGQERIMTITKEKFQEYVNNGDIKEYYGDDPTLWGKSNYILFNYNNKQRMIFYYYSPLNWYENLEHYKALGLEEMVKSETTTISLGCDEDAKIILETLVKAFGGWIDYNDCDDIGFVKFEKGAEIPTAVRHITMEDVYKAFGGFVIIDR